MRYIFIILIVITALSLKAQKRSTIIATDSTLTIEGVQGRSYEIVIDSNYHDSLMLELIEQYNEDLRTSVQSARQEMRQQERRDNQLSREIEKNKSRRQAVRRGNKESIITVDERGGGSVQKEEALVTLSEGLQLIFPSKAALEGALSSRAEYVAVAKALGLDPVGLNKNELIEVIWAELQ